MRLRSPLEWAFYVMPHWTAKIEAGGTTRVGDRELTLVELAGEIMRPALALEYAWRIKHAPDRATKERLWALMDRDLKQRIKDLERKRAV